ncbi:hypothetical protein [Listeria sp. PSOL-1]|uniref:hypothetical protein n=1 Tax=Listeria sp. PSOL-1 TaxID=1844999 RepID=UPI0013D533EF|nr:hypothetical protein [Listeria sp. PSOL-1]
MFFKELYKLQLVFVFMFGLILAFRWFNILTSGISVVLITIFFIIWTISIMLVIFKKTKQKRI